MAISKTSFGITEKGEQASLYSLTNHSGTKLVVSDFGAVWVSLFVRDKAGKIRDVVLGYDKLEHYEHTAAFFGAIVGRSANRIEHASFTLNGKKYSLQDNENGNNLHSGPDGYEARMWDVKQVDEAKNAVTFAIDSPDGDQGFPGNLHMEVTYRLTDDNRVSIRYKGTCDQDTVVNMTNHTYFNLEGHDQGSILDHVLWIDADSFTPVADSKSIPTGEIRKVAGTPMNFNTPKKIGADIQDTYDQLTFTGGYDHNYVLKHGGQGVRKIATLYAPSSGIEMEVETDCVGVQFYAGNFISGPRGKHQVEYQPRCGACLETQYFPNAINTPEFPSPVLKAGDTYESTTIYHFA